MYRYIVQVRVGMLNQCSCITIDNAVSFFSTNAIDVILKSQF